MRTPRQRHTLRPLLLASLLATWGAANATTATWDPTRPTEVQLDTVVAGDRKYNNMNYPTLCAAKDGVSREP